MTSASNKRIRVILGVLALVALLGVVGWLAAGQFGDTAEPDSEWVAAHPAIQSSQSCTSCKADQHDYAHKEPYTGECDACHTTSSWRIMHYAHENADFNTSFHAIIGCERCHDEGTPPPSPVCETCHLNRSPHGAGTIACSPCHTPIAWALRRPLPEGHLSLEGGHEPLSCFDCHSDGVKTEAGTARGCVDCHGENHGGLTTCEDCHDPARGWDPVPGFDHSLFFKLEGRHAQIECGACHTGGDFAGTPSTCSGCHGTMHGGLTQCQECHDPARGWDPVPGFDHSLFFKLEGKHTQADCAECHKNNTFAGTPTVCLGCHTVAHTNLTRCEDCHTPFGFVPSTFDHDQYFKITGGHAELACQACHPNGVYNGTPTVCTGCHGTAHGGLTACQDCHTTAGFVPSTFVHATKFELVGTHATLACDACHPGYNYASNIGGGSTTCDSCHDGPHGATFTDCVMCHTPTTWADITLAEHPGEIKLGEKHTAQSCRLCHPTLRFTDDPTTPCEDCHLGDVPHVGPTTCIDCHRPTTWAEVHFTHPELGIHENNNVNTQCLWCHPGPDFTDWDCTGCHGPGGIPMSAPTMITP